MRRLALLLSALLVAACTDTPVSPDRTPTLERSGGRRQLTSTLWEKSTTGVDILPIGLFNDHYTILVDINDNGLAVGWGYTPDGQNERAISWANGVFTDLGTLGGDFSRAHQSNNAGTIVGESQDADGRYHAVVWENGVIRALPPLGDSPFGSANAQSINERGDIAGESVTDFGITHAALWPASGGVIDLGALPGTDFSRARGINRNGDVLGQSNSFGNFVGRPTIWTAGAISEIVLPSGGRALSSIATGHMYNDAGNFIADVAADAFNTGRAIVFRNGAFEMLPLLPDAAQPLSQPNGLNEAGDVVGLAYAPFNFEPVLWSHGDIADLGVPLGFPAGEAHGINNRGLVVGQAHGQWTPGVFNSGAALWRVAVPDATPPTVVYSSHPSTFAVDQHVSITCTATDAESGIASNTCGSIDGDAYVFGLGPHTFSATATDNAGNSASASTTFSVIVTFSSLTNLTRRFVTNTKVAGALAAKLRDAEEARAKGKVKA